MELSYRTSFSFLQPSLCILTKDYGQGKSSEQKQRPLSVFNRSAAELPYDLPLLRREMDFPLQLCCKSIPGSHNIPYQMIFHFPESSHKFLFDLFNRIFMYGTVSSTRKEAIIIPTLKPGKDASILGNYSCICKLMQKMVNFWLTWLLEMENG